MATPAYRAARGSTGLIIVLVLLMEAGMLGMVPLAGPQHQGTGRGWFFAIPPVVALVVGLSIAFTRHRRRLSGVSRELGRLGFIVDMKPSANPTAQAELWTLLQPLAQNLWLQGDARNVRWMAWQSAADSASTSDEAARRAWLFEFEFVTGSGKSTQVHPRTVALWPAGYPGLPGSRLGNAPGFWLARFGWFRRRLYKKAPRPEAVGLAKVWTVFGDVTTGSQFVTDRMRALLANSPKGECWHLGDGYVGCVFQNRLNGPGLGVFYQRARKAFER